MDRKEAIEYAKFRLECHTKGDGEYTDYGEFLVAAIEALQEQERKKGHWERYHKYEFGIDEWGHSCSECGHEIPDDNSSIIKNFLLPNFCEHCGADMRGKQNK